MTGYGFDWYPWPDTPALHQLPLVVVDTPARIARRHAVVRALERAGAAGLSTDDLRAETGDPYVLRPLVEVVHGYGIRIVGVKVIGRPWQWFYRRHDVWMRPLSLPFALARAEERRRLAPRP